MSRSRLSAPFIESQGGALSSTSGPANQHGLTSQGTVNSNFPQQDSPSVSPRALGYTRQKQIRKDREFREYLVSSGTAESFLKLIIALRDHETFTGREFPLPVEEITGVPLMLYDYFGSQPDPVWGEISYLQENIEDMREKIEDGEDRMEELQELKKTYAHKAVAVRAWKALSNLEGVNATELEEGQIVEKRDAITGKEFLTRLLGAYKKLPSPDLVELENISKVDFVETCLANYNAWESFLTDVSENLVGEKSAGPFYANPEDTEHTELLVSLVNMLRETLEKKANGASVIVDQITAADVAKEVDVMTKELLGSQPDSSVTKSVTPENVMESLSVLATALAVNNQPSQKKKKVQQPVISDKEISLELGLVLADLAKHVLFSLQYSRQAQRKNKLWIRKLRKVVDHFRRLAKKQNNTDMRILSLALKLACTVALRKEEMFTPENVQLATRIQALVREVSDPRNLRTDTSSGKTFVWISPRAVGLMSQLAAEAKARSGTAQAGTTAVLAPDTKLALQDLTSELKAKSDDFCFGDLYAKAWKDKIDKVFEAMDADKTGFVSRGELLGIYENVKDSVYTSAAERKNMLVEKLFAAVDEDGDDRISYDEWICYIADAENSGEHTVEEISFELSMFLKGKGLSNVAKL